MLYMCGTSYGTWSVAGRGVDLTAPADIVFLNGRLLRITVY